MGADLILATIDVTDLDQAPDEETARAELARRIDEVTEVPVWWDYDPPESLVEPGDEGTLDGWRRRLRDAAEILLTGDAARDVTTIEAGGRTLLVAGGMSWGDSPTAAVDAFTDLNEAGILDAPWPWVQPPAITRPYLVIEGDPAGGFRFYGPYPDYDTAWSAGVRQGTSLTSWWTAQIEAL